MAVAAVVRRRFLLPDFAAAGPAVRTAAAKAAQTATDDGRSRSPSARRERSQTQASYTPQIFAELSVLQFRVAELCFFLLVVRAVFCRTVGSAAEFAPGLALPEALARA